ncbi:hypothetical protein F5Y09DRAFT_306975 [Xylaria sp. FL1042]|nr:hypothetical protein F5Y09DRAFT_306975 [Xylaria sp. FL1042]
MVGAVVFLQVTIVCLGSLNPVTIFERRYVYTDLCPTIIRTIYYTNISPAFWSPNSLHKLSTSHQLQSRHNRIGLLLSAYGLPNYPSFISFAHCQAVHNPITKRTPPSPDQPGFRCLLLQSVQAHLHPLVWYSVCPIYHSVQTRLWADDRMRLRKEVSWLNRRKEKKKRPHWLHRITATIPTSDLQICMRI